MIPEIDIAFEEHETLVRLKPLSPKARMWFRRYVTVEDSTLVVNGWIPTDKGQDVRGLLENAIDDGLRICPISPGFLDYAWKSSLPTHTIFLLS